MSEGRASAIGGVETSTMCSTGMALPASSELHRQLQRAAGVGGDDGLRSRRHDMPDLTHAQRARHLPERMML